MAHIGTTVLSRVKLCGRISLQSFEWNTNTSPWNKKSWINKISAHHADHLFKQYGCAAPLVVNLAFCMKVLRCFKVCHSAWKAKEMSNVGSVLWWTKSFSVQQFLKDKWTPTTTFSGYHFCDIWLFLGIRTGLKVTVLHPQKKFNRMEQQVSQPYQKTTSRNASSNGSTAGASALSAEGLYFKSD